MSGDWRAGPSTTAQEAGQIADHFRGRFGVRPRVFRAPGRINIIGEHTDYSGGFAAPAAIDRACLVAAAANGTDCLNIKALTLNQEVMRPIERFTRTGGWSDYVAGVAAALAAEGRTVRGGDLVIASDVPIGAGVSSSAALTVATTMALAAIAELELTQEDVRRLAWTAENRFAGVPCGPLDQFASVFGRRDHALLLDCRSLTARPLPAPADVAFVLVDSGVRHRLQDGGYEQRRRACEAAASALGLAALRDADLASLDRLEGELKVRARHVVTENARTLALAATLEQGDCAAAGALIRLSHASLRDDFAVTCPETDLLADIANATPGVFGARQMGGGFGGCVLALVRAAAAEDAGQRISAQFRAAAGVGGDWFACKLSGGAEEISP